LSSPPRRLACAVRCETISGRQMRRTCTAFKPPNSAAASRDLRRTSSVTAHLGALEVPKLTGLKVEACLFDINFFALRRSSWQPDKNATPEYLPTMRYCKNSAVSITMTGATAPFKAFSLKDSAQINVSNHPGPHKNNTPHQNRNLHRKIQITISDTS